MLPISDTLRPFVTDITYWCVSTFNDNTMQAHLIITVLVWRSTPPYLRRKIRRALHSRIRGNVIRDAARDGHLPPEFFNWPIVLKVGVLTDKRDR